MKNILLFGILLTISFVQAQEDAWVYFTDKPNVQEALANPSSILTQRAIDRKTRHNISIDERDVPVNESYIAQLKNATGITVLAKSKWLNAAHVRGSESDISNLQSLDFVQLIDFASKEISDIGRRAFIGDTPDIENETFDFEYGQARNQVEMLKTDQLHLSDYTGEGIIIAVMDSGFPNVTTMSAFERIRSNGDYLGGYDFPSRTENVTAYAGGDHGTRVLSTMAGFVPDQYVGTAPDASYYLFRTEIGASENPVEESYWVEAAERADSLGVDIINTSLGYTTFDESKYNYSPSDMDGNTTFISRGANIAGQKGMLVVTSAGNSGNSTWGVVGAPADSPNVFTIGAVTNMGQYATFSSKGSNVQPTIKPDVVAQGAPAAVINSNNTIVLNNGTSFSSPIMAGSLASLWQAMPDIDSETLKQIVRESASQANSPDFLLGYGIPNMSDALSAVLSVKKYKNSRIEIFPNPVKSLLNFKVESNSESSYRIFDVLGKKVFSGKFSGENHSVDLSNLSPGLYLLKLESGNFSESFRIIKS